MLTHIVVWKYRADVSAALREEHQARLRALRNIVPGIESLAVGFDFLRGPNSYDIGLLAQFRDRSALDAYTVHPEHVMAVEFSRQIVETMAKVDFED
jgi:Stress responsive A/B Barrel Domain